MTITIQENISLASSTTMRTGGPARFFISVESVDELREALLWAEKENVRIWILGGGSNTLVSDSGFPGLVIKISIQGVSYEEDGDTVRMIVGAGEVWDNVVESAVSRGLWGIENLSRVPGYVGGAVVQNIGAYGVEVRESVLWVEVFDREEKNIKRFSCEESEFEYRKSIFKVKPQFIVLRVALGLTRVDHPRTEYEDVKKYFIEQGIGAPSLAQIRNAIIAIREAKMPGVTLGTAGSFFKNPIVSKEESVRIANEFPGIKTFPVSAYTVKLSAAWLIDKVGGFRGVRQGDAGTYEKQALILVNYGNATSSEIISLAENIKNIIFKKTGVMLEEEVVMMK